MNDANRGLWASVDAAGIFESIAAQQHTTKNDTLYGRLLEPGGDG